MRDTLHTLRQPRYAALTALMIVVALVCIGAGTWQIARLDWKVRANEALTSNAHAAATSVGDVLPMVGAPAPSGDSVRYRTVTASGTYETRHQALVRLATLNSTQGFYVLTPLTTQRGTLLVVRGFVAARGNGAPPAVIAAAPAGAVTIRARVQTGASKNDSPGGVPTGQLVSINPTDQARRLAAPMYDGYVQLLKGQPGQAGLTAIPPPSLSNPAGGAVEPQHFAYIIQWYLFALLALAAPLAMSRAERRELAGERARTAGPSPAPALTEEQRRAAKLADRYGRAVH
jgi:cytochrome oxidase assembly protein ShyY1